MGQFWTKVFRHKDVRILLLGLDGAGKTTLLYRLKLGEIVTHIPTIGFNVEQLQYKNISFTAWDIGARDKMRPLFRHYYKGTDAVIIVVDASDHERLEELFCDVLKPALNAEELTNSVFLFLANKIDLPGTMEREEIAQKLNLKNVKHIWNLIETSAIRGDGLTDCMDWLTSQLGSVQSRKTNSQQLTAHHGSVQSRKPYNPSAQMTSERPKTITSEKPSFDSSKDKLQNRDYCTRAYSAFRCFFIRPNVPPDIQE